MTSFQIAKMFHFDLISPKNLIEIFFNNDFFVSFSNKTLTGEEPEQDLLYGESRPSQLLQLVTPSV